MKSTNFLKEMSWKTFEKRKQETDLVIIPTGAFEVYGPHLPLGTDTLVSVKMAELVSQKVNAIIGPTLEVGDSSMLDEFPGTVTIKPESFKEYLNDVVNSMLKWGFKDFLFITGHAANVPIVNQIGYSIRRNEGIRCAQIDFWRFIKTQDQGIVESGDFAHRHASEAGTSVMLYLYPELVDTEKWVDEPNLTKDEFPEIIKLNVKMSSYSKSGVTGYATLGTKEKGEQLVNRSVDKVIDFLHKSWDIK